MTRFIRLSLDGDGIEGRPRREQTLAFTPRVRVEGGDLSLARGIGERENDRLSDVFAQQLDVLASEDGSKT